MGYSYRIEPSIGVARVGDSEPGDSTDVNYFYLSPETIGGRPLECDVFGITATPPVPVTKYKDKKMRVRRQGAKFRVMRYDDDRPADPPEEIKAAPGVSLEWTVHIANKKAAWYAFSELQGNLYLNGDYSETNSYQNQNVPRRNASAAGEPAVVWCRFAIDASGRTAGLARQLGAQAQRDDAMVGVTLRLEQRWPDRPFWRSRHGRAVA